MTRHFSLRTHNTDFHHHAAFARRQQRLTRFNRDRLAPGLGESDHRNQRSLLAEETAFIAASRQAVAPLMADVPRNPNAFLHWFESLREWGPGQGDLLFSWLAEKADYNQMRWFLTQELAGEAGFDDLVAMAQVKMPTRAKLEMARNYWDEMGRGDERGMHGPMLTRLAEHFEIAVDLALIVPEALALGNMMVALAFNRRFAFHAVGALGAIELTAPTRAVFVAAGLERLGVPPKARNYFALHATLDVKHSESWNREVIRDLVVGDARRAAALAEGALLRLWCGARCFDRYRLHFGL
jgi:hypothetical protein